MGRGSEGRGALGGQINAMLKHPLLPGFVLIWLSVAVIPIGTHFRVNSPDHIVRTARARGIEGP